MKANPRLPIVGTNVGALAVQRGGVVGNAEENLEHGFQAQRAAACRDGRLFARSGSNIKSGIGECPAAGRLRITASNQESEQKDL
jgi:hypothetical protein